jgi:hypothetical protein
MARSNVDHTSEQDVEAAWSAEIERRLVEIDAGVVELVAWEDVRLELSGESDPEVQEAWAAEVERRESEIENGSVSLLSGPETLAKLKAEFE